MHHKSWSILSYANRLANLERNRPVTDDPAWLFQNTNRKWGVRFGAQEYISLHSIATCNFHGLWSIMIKITLLTCITKLWLAIQLSCNPDCSRVPRGEKNVTILGLKLKIFISTTIVQPFNIPRKQWTRKKNTNDWLLSHRATLIVSE